MIVKQVSVFVENTVGRLAGLTKILAENDIDLKASTIAETVDFGILRCIVEDPEKTVKILIENGFTASLSEVIGVSLEDKAGGLHHVLALLADAGIAVNYIYSTIKSAEGKAIIMMKVADSDKAVEVLKSSGVELVGVESL
ncbi:MAG: ACT domain-containing protein [Anaerovoracaceae bacterium]